MKFNAHINIQNLNVFYGEQQILNNISINIPDKKITAIIGPSGCGKTTFLKSLNRLLEPVNGVRIEGEVLVDGENLYDPKAEITHIRKKMGLLSQRPQVLPMSIYDNIAYGPRIHGIKGKKILEQIERLEERCPFTQVCPNKGNIKQGREIDVLVECYLRLSSLWDEIKDRLHQPASRLSIGQQQRLCLARGLAVEPEIILGDEPTSALDPQSSQTIEKLLMELKKDYTIIVVTHILRQAKRLADYVIFLYLGELVEHGEAEEIFNNPKNPKTISYIKGEIS